MSNLYKLFNKNTVKLSFSCMPNVANLIIKSNNNSLRTNQCIEPTKRNCINKTIFPWKGKCQYECVIYNLEEHTYGPKNIKVSCNDKKS